MGLGERLLDKVASYREQMIAAQRRLVAIPALGPLNQGEGEMAKAAALEASYRGLGLKVKHWDAPDPRVPGGLRPNLVATLEGGKGPAIFAIGHLDVVPAGEPSAWTADPWTLRVAGDRLYGRGTLDNHVGLLCPLFGLKALLETGTRPAGRVGLVAVSDEETSSEYGLDYLLGAAPELFSPHDLVVIPDSGREDGGLIEVAEKSLVWLRVEVTGRQVHASTPEKGVNALAAAARMMAAIREVREAFPQEDPLFSPPGSTLEPTRQEPGVANINTVPGKAVFYVDCRILPSVPVEAVEAALEKRFAAIACEEGATVAISPVQRQVAPPATPADAPVVRALMKAIARTHGIAARPGGIGGGTVAAFFRQRGLPAAVWSTNPDTAHVPDEYCLLSDMVKDAQVFALLFAGLPA